MLKQSAVVAVGEKIVATTKKARQSRSHVKMVLIVFFMIGRVSFTMSLFHVLRQSIRGLPKRPEVFDGGSAKDED